MKSPTQHFEDDCRLSLKTIAAALLINIASSAAVTFLGHNGFGSLDTVVKAVLMCGLAVAVYVRPVEYGAQLLENQQHVVGTAWLGLIFAIPLGGLWLYPYLRPLQGLVLFALSAIIANIVTHILLSFRDSER